MSPSRIADFSRDLDGHGEPQDVDRDDPAVLDESRSVILVLKELLDCLSRSGGDGASALSAEAVERWVDEDYLYLEAALPGAADAVIDVSIQGGRAFIRGAR